ncbi:uncharacterized protein At2g33490-like [Nymphaea colorata]|nr:uncharacterized protein At2g33490-like [Nymphaea colorata]
MKSSFKKLRGFALHKSDAKVKRSPQRFSQIDELARATQDMQDMRNCYDSLFAAAAATANAAYEFSLSLRELGSCLLEKTALNDDEDTGRVLLMLGKAQYQIQKFVDSYRSHISKTITSPSDSLLNELQILEDMKRQCDDKRDAYEYMVASQSEKGRSKNARENVSPEKLKAALDEYEDEATLFIFRLKSLKQGQSRSLLTQAVRHHAAQMNLFKKGFKFLESVEPHVKVVTEQQQIDYQFSGLEDDDAEDGDDESYDANDDGELSDFEQPHHVPKTISTMRHMDLDDRLDHASIPTVPTEPSQGIQGKVQRDSCASTSPNDGCHSAPILAYHDKKSDTEDLREVKPSAARKLNTYVLPTPGDAKSTLSASRAPPGRQINVDLQACSLFHSLPLGPKKQAGDNVADQSSGAQNLSQLHSLLKESNTNNVTGRASVHLGEGVSLHTSDWRNFSDNKKIKRQAFSGPLTGKPLSNKPIPSAGGSTASLEPSVLVSGAFARIPVSQRPPPSKVSPSSSPPLMSSPKISELHELPRPPGGMAKNDVSSKGSLVAHSAPLVSRSQQRSLAEKHSARTTATASPLPRPPATMARSFSIPSRGGQRTEMINYLDPPPVDLSLEVSSPPLTPLAFPTSQPKIATVEVTAKATE